MRESLPGGVRVVRGQHTPRHSGSGQGPEWQLARGSNAEARRAGLLGCDALWRKLRRKQERGHCGSSIAGMIRPIGIPPPKHPHLIPRRCSVYVTQFSPQPQRNRPPTRHRATVTHRKWTSERTSGCTNEWKDKVSFRRNIFGSSTSSGRD